MKLAKLISAMREGIGANDVMAYLVMMAARMTELHRILKATGSIYLHCDPTMSHYIKLILDQIFSPLNFRNEIVWRRTNVHSKLSKQYGPIHDIVLFYSKSDHFTFHAGHRPYLKAYIEERFKFEDDRGRYQLNYLTGLGTRKGESGQPWKGFDPTEKGRHWAIPASLRPYLPPEAKEMTLQQQLDWLYEKGLINVPKKSGGQPMYKQYIGEGIPYQDIWAYQPHTQGLLLNCTEGIDEDVKWLDQEEEKLDYPTQKPIGLVARIIETSSDEGDVLLDPFCGCGTALAAAHKLNRQWIGIDITHLAINVMKRRLQDHFPGIQFKVIGEPSDLPSARELAKQNRYQFQWWALSLIDARPLGEKKKGADQGIDGVVPFADDGGTKLKRVVVQVKSGHVGVKDVRELITVASKDAMGLLLSLEEPTQPMKTEAAAAGFYESPAWQKKFPRIQIITVKEIFRGQKPNIPPSVPLPKAPAIRKGKQPNLV